MKKLFGFFIIVVLIACHGNENANVKPTELDNTINNDTSARADTIHFQKTDSMDSTHKNLKK